MSSNNTLRGAQKRTGVADEWYTPRSAVDVILRHAPSADTHPRVWSPFDTDDSHFVSAYRERGHTVTATHISTGGDFFSLAPNVSADTFDMIVSNPPYSMLTDVFTSLFATGIPWAMLVPIPSVFDAIGRRELFRKNGVQLLIPNKRINFDGDNHKSSVPFLTVYACWNLLDRDIVFDEPGTA